MAKDKKEAENAEALPEGQAENPKKKSKLKKIIIILVILLVSVAGIIGGFLFFNRGALPFFGNSSGDGVKQEETAAPGSEAPAGEQAQGEAGKAQEGKGEASGEGSPRVVRQADLPRSTGVVVPLPSITVNLFDDNGTRYLKLGMEVEANSDISAALKSQEARIRDAIIMLLAGKRLNDLATPEGKVMLKAEVANRLNQIMGEQRIVRVFFTDFVVQ